MTELNIHMERLPGRYAICRLEPDAPVPSGVGEITAGRFCSITRTDRELSIVVEEQFLPSGASMRSECGWVCFRLLGPLALDMVGIIARISTALAGAEVPVFALSTYDTDYFFIGEEHEERAMDALSPWLRR